ncbi:Las1-like-domain-containing protein [Lipomyces japonicus]|uniref:Las1-like-domain-containing protein n=1 Tax=Lipomyces japonicus TaxID=56871 RepID=UPI0034CFE917
MSRHPRIVPYRTAQDLKDLYTWFYESESDVPRALSLVKAYSSRGNVPFSVECTALLKSCLILDNQYTESFALRLAYSSALIRFVNGSLDSYQTSQFALPLHLLATKIGLPTYFVELRHECTHEELPSLSTLRTGARRAVAWLKEKYWDVELSRIRDPKDILKQRFSHALRSYTDGVNIHEIDIENEDPEVEVVQPEFGDNKFSRSAEGRKQIKILSQISQQYSDIAVQNFTEFIEHHINSIASETNAQAACLVTISTFSPVLRSLSQATTDSFLLHCVRRITNQVNKDRISFNSGQVQKDNHSADIIPLSNPEIFATPVELLAKYWISHILAHHDHVLHETGKLLGFSFSVQKFVKKCIQVGPPTPVVIEVFDLVDKYVGQDAASAANLIKVYRMQASILYRDKRRKLK